MTIERDSLRELELLIQSRCPVIALETIEEDRVMPILNYLGDRMKLPVFTWSPSMGLRCPANPDKVYGCTDAVGAMAHLLHTNLEAICYFREFHFFLNQPMVIEKLKDIAHKFSRQRGALIFSMANLSLPSEIDRLVSTISLGFASAQEYENLLDQIIRDSAERLKLEVKLTAEDKGILLSALRGLTLMEAQKVLTKAIINDRKLARDEIEIILDAKKQIIERQGILEYYPHELTLTSVAGFPNLKGWLKKRRAVFLQPDKAKSLGVPFPSGILLVGAQGCGKSLCAKAVASEWKLPLLRFDTSNLYHKYLGESEQNLRKAMKMAEAMAPLVLWIDEIEKAFAGSSSEFSEDNGTSKRIFGTFLTWLQEKRADVFVVATSNDISRLPPEFIRKGRFDEIFFVDLPDLDTRKKILTIHLTRKNYDASTFDLDALSKSSDGFSGAEIEQAIISALYSAFSQNVPVNTDILLHEMNAARPLSRTMRQKLEQLRTWASAGAVPA